MRPKFSLTGVLLFITMAAAVCAILTNLRRIEVQEKVLEELRKGAELDSDVQGLTVRLDGDHHDGSSLDAIGEYGPIFALTLKNTKITDTDFLNVASANASAFTTCEYLEISSAVMSSRCLAAIRYFPRLKSFAFFLRHAAIDQNIGELSSAVHLENLDLSMNEVSPGAFKQLRKLTALQTLTLSFAFVEEQDLRDLGSLKSVRHLLLNGTSITGEGFADFNAPSLETLDLSDCEYFSDDGLAHLKRFSNLRKLNLRATAVSDRGAIVLADFPKLEDVDVFATSVSDSTIEKLKRQRSFLKIE